MGIDNYCVVCGCVLLYECGTKHHTKPHRDNNMARLVVNLRTQTFYPAYATGKNHLMNAKHAERIIAARNAKPEYVRTKEDDSEELRAHFQSAAYKQYERNYRAALAESRVLCIQRQTRVYATPRSEPINADALPDSMCVKCMSHVE